MQVSVSIPLFNVSVRKWRCLKCLVQLSSTCVIHKIPEVKETLNKQPFRLEHIAGVYCAAGTSVCIDIKVGQDRA